MKKTKIPQGRKERGILQTEYVGNSANLLGAFWGHVDIEYDPNAPGFSSVSTRCFLNLYPVEILIANDCPLKNPSLFNESFARFAMQQETRARAYTATIIAFSVGQRLLPIMPKQLLTAPTEGISIEGLKWQIHWLLTKRRKRKKGKWWSDASRTRLREILFSATIFKTWVGSMQFCRLKSLHLQDHRRG